MSYKIFFFVLFIVTILTPAILSQQCQNVTTINLSLKDFYNNGPFFTTFMPATQNNLLVDNMCFTLFPTPDNPDTYILYEAIVYCNGTTVFKTAVAKDISPGVFTTSTTNSITRQNVVGCTGCESEVTYNCCPPGSGCNTSFVFGNGYVNKPLTLSCFRRAQQIIAAQNLSQVAIYPLPMRLPNACVTQQVCKLRSNPCFLKCPC